MTDPDPITEDDLHGFVDQRLGSARCAEVQAYLDAHPAFAAEVAAFHRQRAALRAAAAPIAEEPIPPRLNIRHVMEMRRRAPPWSWRALAASVVLLLAGGAAGWVVRGAAMERAPANGTAALAREAAYTFDVFGADHVHPVEFTATDKAQLLVWIASRIGRTIAVPDLTASGYGFMGGRLVATPHGAAGLLMYSNAQGQRLVMLVRPMAIDRNSRMSEHSYGPIHGFAWSSQGTGFSVVGPAPAQLLHPIANEVRRQEGSVL